MKYFLGVVSRHFLDFCLVVVNTHSNSGDFCTGKRRRLLRAEQISVEVTPDHLRQRIK